MSDAPDDADPTLGEMMNRAMYLDPGFTVDRPGLIDAIHAEIDETVIRAQAALDDRRADEAAAAVAKVPELPDKP